MGSGQRGMFYTENHGANNEAGTRTLPEAIIAQTPRDTVSTTEYSMRTGMEAVYTLARVDRGVPEVWGSVYDVRNLLNASVKLRGDDLVR